MKLLIHCLLCVTCCAGLPRCSRNRRWQMSCQFFKVSGETENSRVVIFVCLFVCQGLVNGISNCNVIHWQRLGLTFVEEELCVMSLLEFSEGHCWAVVEVWLIQSFLKQGQFQSGIRLLQGVWSWSVCSMKGGCQLSPAESAQGIGQRKG